MEQWNVRNTNMFKWLILYKIIVTLNVISHIDVIELLSSLSTRDVNDYAILELCYRRMT